MIVGSIARRYAKALLGIGIDSTEYEKFGQELDQFAALLQYKDLRDALENPALAQSKRRALMEELISRLRPSSSVRNFLLLLVDRHRVTALPGIAREYRAMADKHAGRVRAQVTTSEALDPAGASRLTQALEQKTGKKIILEQATNPELIAGMVTKIGSIIYDGSIRTRLEQMRQTLLEGQR